MIMMMSHGLLFVCLFVCVCVCVLGGKWHLVTNNKKAQELSAQGQRITANWRNKEIRKKLELEVKEMQKRKKKYFWCWILRPGAKAC